MSDSLTIESGISIRPAALADLDALLELDTAVFGTMAYPRFVVRQFLDVYRSCWLIAQGPTGMRGYALAVPAVDGTCAWLFGLGVREEFRHMGCGRLLTVEALALLRKLEVPVARLTVEPENIRAIALYADLGFTVTEHAMDYLGPGEHRTVMAVTGARVTGQWEWGGDSRTSDSTAASAPEPERISGAEPGIGSVAALEPAAGVVFRLAAVADLDQITEVDGAVFGDMEYPYFVLRQLYDVCTGLCVVAEVDGVVRGYALAAVEPFQRTAWLLGLAVLPEHRGAGHGAELLGRVLDLCGKVPVDLVKITVRPTNQSAYRIYAAAGFEEVDGDMEEACFGHGEPRSVLVKTLTDPARSEGGPTARGQGE